MKDPPRLLSPRSGATAFERRVLDAWHDERPTAAARNATVAALGLAGRSASRVAWLHGARWLLVAVGLAAPIAMAIRDRPTQRGVASVPPTAEPAESAPPPPRAPATAVQPPAEQPRPITTPRATRRALPRSPQPSRSASSLGAEIAAVDRARRAIEAGSPSRALALVDDYDLRFPAGELRDEATVVRIEALFASGRSDAATREAEAYRRDHPNSPHAARLREMLESDRPFCPVR